MFAIPTGDEAVEMIVLGDRGDPANLTDNHRAGELTARTRRPTTEFVLSGQWGETSTFLQVYLLGLFRLMVLLMSLIYAVCVQNAVNYSSDLRILSNTL